jgi:5-methyltetrahydropteroyltriglutamate--homocysteine methyltransferase
MKRSTERILVTHQGTLPREPDLRELVVAKEEGGSYDETELSGRLRRAVAQLVDKQCKAGVDFVNDGEQSKSSFQYYARSRLGGHQDQPSKGSEPPPPLITNKRDQLRFPGFFNREGAAGGRMSQGFRRRQSFVTEPLRYIGHESVRVDIDNLKAAVADKDVAGGVLMAVAPGTIEHWLHNEYYSSQEEFLFAVADAMHEEYKAITDSGLIVHIDDPDLADGWQIYPDMQLSEYRRYAELRVEALNRALQGIPSENVILHVCWGSGHHPHVSDLPLRDLIDLFLKVNALGISIEAANPRHEWEWTVFEDVKLPDDKVLIPGVVGHASDIVEHPELIAQRLVRYANLVGRENVVGGTDCGLGSRVGHAEVAWAKLAAMADGARIATKRLWSR